MTTEKEQTQATTETPTEAIEATATEQDTDKPREIGGPKGLEPTRYGDWEKAGRCIDF